VNKNSSSSSSLLLCRLFTIFSSFLSVMTIMVFSSEATHDWFYTFSHICFLWQHFLKQPGKERRGNTKKDLDFQHGLIVSQYIQEKAVITCVSDP
jgi:hypothetical protein